MSTDESMRTFEFYQKRSFVRRCCGEPQLAVYTCPLFVVSALVLCSYCHAELARFEETGYVNWAQRLSGVKADRAFFAWPGMRCNKCAKICLRRLAISCVKDGEISVVRVLGGEMPAGKKCVPDDPADDWILRALPRAENG